MKELYSESGPERVGFLGTRGEIIEVHNCHADPHDHFYVSAEDLIRLEDEITATWHTHPGRDSNLSVDDQAAFAMYPDIPHYIIGNDGVRCYRLEGNRLVQEHVA